jgi:hypothetical protein
VSANGLPEYPTAMEAELGRDLAGALWAYASAVASGAPRGWPLFRDAVHRYLDGLGPHPFPDPFFNWIGAASLPRSTTAIALTSLWEPALQAVIEWEDARRDHAHKGSGYYFAGLRDVSFGNLDRAFLYMHQSALEDTWPHRDLIPDSPAGWFITMNASKAVGTAYQFVLKYEQYLAMQLASYRAAGRGALDPVGFRGRLMRNGELFTPVTSIAHVIARLLNVDSSRLGPILENRFAPSLRAGIAFELCLAYEDLLQRRHTSQGALGALIAGPPLVVNVGLRTDPEQKELNRRSGSPADYDQLMDEMLDAGQPRGFARALTGREVDAAIAMTTRNRAGHGGERPGAIDKRFDDVVPHLFFAIFAAVEDLYS